MIKVEDIISDKKLSQILEAAQKVFGLYGFSKTTMNDIARELSISKASLYYYFPDKDHLFRAVMEYEIAQFENRMTAIINTKKSAGLLLTKYVEYRHNFFENLINLSKLSCDRFNEAKPVIGCLIQEFHLSEICLIEKILKKGADEGDFKFSNKKNKARLFINILSGLSLLSMSKNKYKNLDERNFADVSTPAQDFVKIFIKGITSAHSNSRV